MTSFRLSAGFALLLWLLGGLTQCTLRDQERETVRAPALQFRLMRIDTALLGGMDARAWRTPADLQLEQRSRVIRGYANKDLPLRMRLLLAARNPGLQAVTIAHLDYEVLLDDKVLGDVRLSPNLRLPADGRAVPVPLTFSLNTYKMLGNDAMPALRNFSVGLADRRRIPPRLTLRLRPTLLGYDGKPGKPSRPVMLQPDSLVASSL